MCIQASTHLHTPNWHFPLTRHSETFPFSYMKFVCLEISAWEMRVFAAHYASKDADWNQQQVTDGGILANRNSANRPYCFLSNQKKVQILAFLHVICERIVSCPPPENRLQRQRERAWSQASGQAFPLLPSPTPFHFFFYFSRPLLLPHNNSIGNACYAGYKSLQCKLMQLPSFSVSPYYAGKRWRLWRAVRWN